MLQRLHRSAIAITLALLTCPGAAISQQAQTAARPKVSPTVASTLDTQLRLREKALVTAAEAMPADKYAFVPDGDAFKGSRTFALEVKHLATLNFAFYSTILGQALPAGVSYEGAMNGPENLQTKDQIVQFLKDSFALGHKAIATITWGNALTPLNDPNVQFLQSYSLNTRLGLANLACAHATDHYGQMVVYLRMNGITPPASVGSPPANPHSR